MKKEKVKTDKKFRLRPWTVIALVLCAVVIIYTGTSAWLTGKVINLTRLANVDGFEVTASVSLSGGGTLSTDPATGAYVLSTNPAHGSYIGKLRVNVHQDGNGLAFVRVKITHDFYNRTTGAHMQGNAALPYNITGSGFTDKTAIDGYYYYNGAFPANGTVSLIASDPATHDSDYGADFLDPDNVVLLVNVTVEAVQFNRAPQIWGLGRRPWAL